MVLRIQKRIPLRWDPGADQTCRAADVAATNAEGCCLSPLVPMEASRRPYGSVGWRGPGPGIPGLGCQYAQKPSFFHAVLVEAKESLNGKERGNLAVEGALVSVHQQVATAAPK